MKNNRVTVQFDDEVAKLVMGDIDRLGASGSSTVNLIVKQYYENGRTFRNKAQDEQIDLLKSKVEGLNKELQTKKQADPKVKDLETKLKAKEKELVATKKNLASHADRVDKQYKEIAALKKSKKQADPKVKDLETKLKAKDQELAKLKSMYEEEKKTCKAFQEEYEICSDSLSSYRGHIRKQVDKFKSVLILKHTELRDKGLLKIAESLDYRMMGKDTTI